jgi:hypothetical protein
MDNTLDTPTTPMPEVVVESSKKKKWLPILVILLSILFLTVTGYIVYKEFFEKEDVVDNTPEVNETTDEPNIEDPDVCEVGEEDCEDEEEEEVVQSNSFEGEVITATLPSDWSIIEYFDGDGTESLPGEMGNYYGLTAIDIINPDNLQVFTIQAVSGIGFVGCPNYALFEDDNPAYQSEQESISNEMGETLNVTDYTDKQYTEFEFLGVTFRRIGDQYFYDTQEGNNYFEPPCVEGLLTLEGLYFTDEDGYKYEAYFYGATEDATESDLVIVDQILESVELVD